jgi:hypothetical protein
MFCGGQQDFGYCNIASKSDYSCFQSCSLMRKYQVSGMVARHHWPLLQCHFISGIYFKLY